MILRTFLALLVFISVAPAAGAASDLRCVGGSQIFFDPRSARLNEYASQRIRDFAAYSRERNLMRLVSLRIESGGDGLGADFDRDLSFRRSLAMRAYLIRLGYRSSQIVVVVGAHYGRPNGVPTVERLDYERMGWVAQLIPREEHERRYPPGLITECF